MINYNDYIVFNENFVHNYNENIENNFSMIGKEYNKKFKYLNSNNKFQYNFEVYVEKNNKLDILNYLQYEFVFIKSDSETFNIISYVNAMNIRISKNNIKIADNTELFIEINNVPNKITNIDNTNVDYDIITVEVPVYGSIGLKCSVIRLCYLNGDNIQFKLINEYKYIVSFTFVSVNDVINKQVMTNQTTNNGYDLDLDGIFDNLIFGNELNTTNSNDDVLVISDVFKNYYNNANGEDDRLIFIANSRLNVPGHSGRCLIINMYSILMKKIFDSIIIENITPVGENNLFTINMANINGEIVINFIQQTNTNSIITINSIVIDSNGSMVYKITENSTLYNNLSNETYHNTVNATGLDTVSIKTNSNAYTFYMNNLSVFGSEPDNVDPIIMGTGSNSNRIYPRILNYDGTNGNTLLSGYKDALSVKNLYVYDKDGYYEYDLEEILSLNLPYEAIVLNNNELFWDDINKQLICLILDENDNYRIAKLGYNFYVSAPIALSHISNVMYISNNYYVFNHYDNHKILKLDNNLNVINYVNNKMTYAYYNKTTSYGSYIYEFNYQNDTNVFMNIINKYDLTQQLVNLITGEII